MSLICAKAYFARRLENATLAGLSAEEVDECKSEVERLASEIVQVRGQFATTAESYHQAVRAARIKRVPRRLLADAMLLLDDEKARIDALKASFSMTAGEYGQIGGNLFGLEDRLSAALRADDQPAVAELTPQVEAARALADKAQDEANAIKEGCHAIRAETDARLTELARRKWI